MGRVFGNTKSPTRPFKRPTSPRGGDSHSLNSKPDALLVLAKRVRTAPGLQMWLREC